MDNFFNGAVSGMFGVLISHPIDTIKTNIQNGTKASNIKYNPKILYRGLFPALSGVGFEKAVVFGTFENTKNYLNSNYCSGDEILYKNNLIIGLSGGLSGLTASAIVAPYERLKILSQSGTKLRLSHIHPNIMFKGLSATTMREIPGFSIYFLTYENLKRISQSDGELGSSFIYGGLSGGLAWAFIYPQDVIKTRIQSSNHIVSVINVASKLYKDGGIRGFYKGFHLALIRAVPLHSGTFMMMEIMKKFNQ